jgi:hypothetical protein
MATPCHAPTFSSSLPLLLFQVCVILDLRTKKQTILQGHAGEVSAMTVSEDKRWLATADQGEVASGGVCCGVFKGG